MKEENERNIERLHDPRECPCCAKHLQTMEDYEDFIYTATNVLSVPTVTNKDMSPYENYSDEELYQVAVEKAKKNGSASISFLQRKLWIGFTKAGAIKDRLTEDGVIEEGK